MRDVRNLTFDRLFQMRQSLKIALVHSRFDILPEPEIHRSKRGIVEATLKWKMVFQDQNDVPGPYEQTSRNEEVRPLASKQCHSVHSIAAILI
ncbi:hypothetical protein TNCT_471381 [Trichonephila clavata]|uniref:Uncharacterized protein n=1 Tax=Trichonephila clavata TaxID=2740835 RepID=A0A8X6HF04_TRICU|nr:hypothetical protein TNCT_471381 [Trichonephila clavata]